MTDTDSWFLVLPDHPAAAAVAAAVRPGAEFVHPHASGRPWLIGRLPAGPQHGRLVRAAAGDVRLAVIGHHDLDEDQLRSWAGRIRDTAGVDRLARSLAGSSHLVASIAGRVRAQGTVSQVRQVFHARHGGITVAADRAAVLAALTGAPIDPVSLASRLLVITPTLLAQPLWSGISAVPPDSWLSLTGDGGARVHRWWQPPEPHLSVARGADGLRDALAAAVDVRTATNADVGTDLSGGLDSTPVSFLAARSLERTAGRLTTVRMGVADPVHDDHVWAAGSTEVLTAGHITHQVFRPGELPEMFDGVAEPVTGLDEPIRWIRTVSRIRRVSAWLGANGATAHLTGHGGDEVVMAKPNYLHGLVWRRPLLARRHMVGFRSLKRWSLGATLAALTERHSYRSWLAEQAGSLVAPFPPLTRPMFAWDYPLRMPPWVNRDAVGALEARIRELAAGAEPLARDRAGHLGLDIARQLGSVVRLAQSLTAAQGATLHAPYLDDRVIEACLAVRPEERTTPWSYKPLMVAAMRDTLPVETLRRATKGEFSEDYFRGLRRHRDQVAEIFDGPLVAEHGLVDTAALRHAALAAYPPGVPQIALDAAMATENWLRSRQQKPVPVPMSGA
ncbi:asparagine synthase [Actinoplanes nipponensis]|uniref:asparagine synthase n=1 Tax=Actinoplanes nipponensis TaxID=135950 RepID=UPI0019413610|nr:asparagine synthase [Actinoplanes nipponensis]